MDIYISAVLSAIIIAIIIVIVSYIWYRFGTWTQFSFKINELPEWVAVPKDGKSIRFRNCKFSVSVGSDTSDNPEMSKKEGSRDVTNILNAMAKQSTGTSMSLVRPLNPFSFTIVGFNDPNSMGINFPSKEHNRWCLAKKSCTTDSDCGGARGSCTSSKYCVNCFGEHTVTLTGEYRVL
jgi:hypothetical protein